MDRNLRLSLIIQAGDRATRPLRDIAGGSRAASQALAGTRDRLKALERAQGDIAGFRALKMGLRSTEGELQAARQRVTELGRAMGQTGSPTRAMTRDFERAKQEAERLERQHAQETRQLGELRTRLGQAGIATTDLARHERELRRQVEGTNQELTEQERRLARTADRERRMAAGRARFGRAQGIATGMAASGAAGIGTGMAMAAPIIAGIHAAQEYESTMTDIGQKADLSRPKTEALGKGLLIAARAANQMPADMQAGVDALAGMGASVPDAVAMMTPIGRAATAYKAEIADLSNASFAATDNLKVPIGQTQKVIDIMAAAGKAGAFEIKDMAGVFPSLTAAYQALGQKGTGAVADLAAGLQIARKGAGDSASAGTNLANVLQKISSPATAKAFEKMGVNLPEALKKAYKEGKTPLEAIAELTNKTLKGDLSKLGYLFEDSQVQQGLRPLIQNMELFRKIRADAMKSDGTTDRDFAERMKDSAEQSKALSTNAATLAITLGAQLLPTVNAGLIAVNGFATSIGDAAKRHPTLAKALAIGAAAFATLFLVLGGGAIVMAGLMAPFAALSFAAGALGIGLLPVIGIAAAVVAGVAALGGAAYLVYSNWGGIAAFFGGLWAGVKSIFTMSIGDIGASIGYFVGYAIGSLYDFGSKALAFLTGRLPGILSTGWSMAWSGFKTAIHAAFITLPAIFYDLGAMVIRGLWNGIKSAPGRLWDAGIRMAHALSGGFRAANKIRSPSRVFMELGGHVIDGLTMGLAAQESEPVQRMDSLSRRLTAAIVTGSALPGMAMAAPGAGGRGPAPVAAAPAPITIQIYGAPGQSEQTLAELVARKLRELGIGGPGPDSPSFADRPDWE
ncbi:phage tail tape measure protein [uncultured Sphingomonas sp.]|uniref:phage tail tape measure protein n=1 Tax=uncultured Sphingomonas sp. TaxID=158754 RepID=UPI0025E06B55|nr:phage tail tape measure protein [uncultured Sphingomonas sp.]